MNSRLRRRLFAVIAVAVIVTIAVLVVVERTTGSQAITVAQAASGDYAGKRVQVTGQVVDNSFVMEENTLVFSIADGSDPSVHLQVAYGGAMSAAFGNQVTAICTGTMSDDGVLICRELVTKCPSKYENATEALEVSELLGYGEGIVDVAVKVSGTVNPDSIGPASATRRFVVVDPVSNEKLDVVYTGGLPEGVVDGATVVLTGSLGPDGCFIATDIAIGN